MRVSWSTRMVAHMRYVMHAEAMFRNGQSFCRWRTLPAAAREQTLIIVTHAEAYHRIDASAKLEGPDDLSIFLPYQTYMDGR